MIGNLRVSALLQKESLPAESANILLKHNRCRHAREGGELVHHAPDVANLTHDGVGTDGEGFPVLHYLLQVFAFQALGRELNRGQRVLDLMGDAPGNIGPGGLSLSAEQLRHVVESDDEALPDTVA